MLLKRSCAHVPARRVPAAVAAAQRHLQAHSERKGPVDLGHRPRGTSGLKPYQPASRPDEEGAIQAQRARTGPSDKAMKITIAVEGCCHGELDKIYATMQHLEQREGKKIDLLICCGDFQAVRNLDDLETMACPPKYRAMQTFYKYYSGEKKAPFPTLFIGGNHEAANHLWELYHGGWAAPNIYFLGFAGVVKFGGLRIGGLSGIFKQHDYTRGHHESLPYSDGAIRSMYHIRDFEVYRLLQVQQPLDVFLTHDWPTNIANHGNKQALLARKTFLRSEVESGTLGSPPAAQLLQELQPRYWFSAHLHTKFAAVVQHPPRPAAAAAGGTSGAARSAPAAQPAAGPGPGSQALQQQAAQQGGNVTRFLSLDKCLPGRDFLQVFELEGSGPPELHYDEEWLAIMRSTHSTINLRHQHAPLPGMGCLRSGPRPEDVEHVRRALAARGSTKIPENFEVTAPAYDPQSGQRKGHMPTRHTRNPQTVALLEMLGLPYNLDHQAAAGGGGPRGPRAPLSLAANGTTAAAAASTGRAAALAAVPNPEEIDLGDLDDDLAADADDAGAAAAAEAGGDDDFIDDGDDEDGAGAGDDEDPMFKAPSDLMA